MYKQFPLVLVSLLLFAPNLFAVISIETDGTNAANLTKITVDGTEYTSFIGAEVTAFNMYGSNLKTTQIFPSGGTSEVGANATNPLEDSSLTSGYTALRSLSFNFDSAVVNRAGADIFLFEVNQTETSYLTLNVTLDGTTIDFGSSGNPFTSIIGSSATYGLSESTYRTTATTLEKLEAIPSFSTFVTSATTPVGYLAIDLSDFGVADGASITDITIAGHSTGADGQYDISGIVAVPEPSSLFLLLVAGASGMLLCRRKRRV